MIICGFPGIGKTFYRESNPAKCSVDLDSVLYHPEAEGWAKGYVENAVNLQGAGNTVLLSMHGDVRAELAKNKIPYALVYPDIALRDEYRDRYRMRGDTEDFVHTLLAYWAPWITSCADDYNAAKLVELRSGEYLSYKLNTLGVLA